MRQEYNRKTVKISMSKFVQDMEPIAVPKHVKDDLDAPVEAREVSVSFSGCSRREILCCHLPLESCKLMREAKSMPDLCRWILSVPSPFVWLTAADVDKANRTHGSFTSGHVIMAAYPNIMHGESSTVPVLAWNSRKIRRVVRSSFGLSVQPSPLVRNILT